MDFVQQKASAGYLNGYADPEYIEDLPKFQLPMLGAGGTYRAFEIKGDSMLPLPSGSAIIAEYVENWRNIKNGDTYVILSQSEGVVYKRVFKEEDDKGHIRLKLVSDNKEYVPYFIEIEDVVEVWRSRMFLSKEFPQPQQEMTMDRLTSIVLDLQQEVMKLKK
ncbi:MAG: S24 family peptidase [Bacteroidota bacterium]